MKVVINRCFGGFGLSKEAYDYLGLEWDYYGFEYDKDRDHPALIECIEVLGTEKASGDSSELAIIEIPDGIEYIVDDYDGMEKIIDAKAVWP